MISFNPVPANGTTCSTFAWSYDGLASGSEGWNQYDRIKHAKAAFPNVQISHNVTEVYNYPGHTTTFSGTVCGPAGDVAGAVSMLG